MILKITTVVGLNVPDGDDPEEIAAEFDNGFMNAIGGFPRAEVIDAYVNTIAVATPAEISERGWE